MAVPDAVLLFAVGRAHAQIHVKHDAFRRATTMDDIDPLAGKIGERKGPRTGIVRAEFEYEIPIADAERMLSTICGDDTLEKERFFVDDAGATWHVDVYSGILNGVVIAEIELKQETQALTLPSWVGKEVTGDPFYKKINMRARALKAHGESLPI